MKKIPHTLLWARPLGKIAAGIHVRNCVKNLCSYPKFTQKLKSIITSVKSRLSTYRFSSAESMASLGLRLKWNATNVTRAINQVTESSMELTAFHSGNLRVPGRKYTPHRLLSTLLKRKGPALIIVFKNLEYLLYIMHYRNLMVNTKKAWFIFLTKDRAWYSPIVPKLSAVLFEFFFPPQTKSWAEFTTYRGRA